LFRTWHDEADWVGKTLSAMHARRWAWGVEQMEELRDGPLRGLTGPQLRARIERGWQAVPAKPMPAQQEAAALRVVLESLPRQADCLSIREHSLVERLLTEGGQTALEDVEDLEAAQALRHRLWVDVGLCEGRPAARLDSRLREAVAQALDRPDHTALRARLFTVHAAISALLYIAGALDDRGPQRLFMQQVLRAPADDEEAQHLAQQYLWASYDCMDYPHGVLLVHPALADPPAAVCPLPGEEAGLDARRLLGGMQGILPEEEPLDSRLAAALQGALRMGEDAADCARELRWLAKQGAPLEALHSVLATRLCVLETQEMRRALRMLWQGVPRWDGVCDAPVAMTVH
jgi:hypothetical protein